jgi:two-component system sensor histidine kinase/response regulator
MGPDQAKKKEGRKKRISRVRSISKDLTMASSIATIVVAVIAISIIYLTSTNKAHSQLELRCNDYIESLATILAVPIWQLEEETIRNTGEFYAQNEEIVRLSIKEKYEKVSYDFQKPDNHRLISKSRNVIYEGEIIGKIEISLTTRFYMENNKKLLVYLGIIVLLIVFFQYFFILVFHRRFLQEPLNNLGMQLTAFAEKKYSVQMKKVPYAEFQPTIKVINQMGEKIQRQIGEIETWNLTLEQKVENRTRKLNNAQQELLKVVEDLELSKVKLVSAQKEAEAATMAKSDFLANMSHEIRTPMNAIIGMAYLALKTSLNPKQHDYLRKIDISAKSLLHLINDILDFSKIEAGKLSMETVEFDLYETLENTADMISVMAREKSGVDVLFDTHPDVPRFLVGDPLRLGQIFVNLGSNAVKFTEKGVIFFTTEFVKMDKDQVHLCFSVKDSGIGMTQEQCSGLFHAFSQADSSITRKHGGSGLGLSISKSLVAMMGGELSVKSQLGIGSEFTFAAVFKKGKTKQAKRSDIYTELANKKILIVDDSLPSRQILGEMLSNLEFDVTAASSGQECLNLVHKTTDSGHFFDIILMDWKMPAMDGIETALAIRNLSDLTLQPKIFMTTAFSRDEVGSLADKASLDGILIKPIGGSSLMNTFMEAFEADVNAAFYSIKDQDADQIKSIQGASILLVEDNEFNQQVAIEILEGVGLLVTLAQNGRESLEILKSQTFDAVLMDIQMPVMDGYQATMQIREMPEHRNLPVIAMTANAMERDRQNAALAGMSDHIAKPIDVKKLFSTLLTWITPGQREIPESLQEKISSDANLKTLEAIEKDSQAINNQSINDLPGIIFETGLKYMGGDEALYKKFLIKFANRFTGFTKNFSETLEEGDTQKARRMAHNLKGVAGTVGAIFLQEKASALELSFHDDTKNIHKLANEMSNALDQVLDGLKKINPDIE